MADEISTVLKEMSDYGGEYSGELANMNDFAFDTQVAQASYDASANTLKAFDTQVAQVSYDASANTLKGYSNKGDYGNLFDYQVADVSVEYTPSDMVFDKYVTAAGVGNELGEGNTVWAYVTSDGKTLMYGVTPITIGERGRIAPAYGVVSPVIGGKVTPITLKMTEDEIKEIISTLKKSANNMENAWEEIKGPIISSIKQAWTSKECDEYISKIEKMNTKVTNSIEALRLLARTYESAIEQLDATTKDIKNAISNL